MRIFVALGTHKQQFNRLLKAVDEIAKNNSKIEFFAQIGNSDYLPKNYAFKKFLTSEEYENEIKKADVVVSHAGAGSIISALAQKKPIVLVPRLKKYGEHTDDHQVDIANALQRKGKAIVVNDLKKLYIALQEAKDFKPALRSSKKKLILRIRKFLSECYEKK
ncbi:MAG: PssE/Cps14G family polysaccharide biosynthesis glycosyltransferase [Candidatus Diapherotrites archaeon]